MLLQNVKHALAGYRSLVQFASIIKAYNKDEVAYFCSLGRNS
jgi:hypothetical protein